MDLLEERSELSEAFEAYWRSLPKEGSLPQFSSFDPLEIATLVPFLFVVRVSEGKEVETKITLTGSEHDHISGTNFTGNDIRSFFEEEARAEALKSTIVLKEHPCGLLQISKAGFRRAKDSLVYLTVFPFISQDPNIFYIAGMLERIKLELDKEHEASVAIEPSDTFAWVDIGYGTP